MRSWPQLAATADRVDATLTHGGDTATVFDAETGDTLVMVSVENGLADRWRDRVLRAAVQAALLEIRRAGA